MNPPARSEMPAVARGDWIYVPGGFGGEARLERYNPLAEQWETLADMPAGRHHLMAATYNESLYIFGGAQAPGWEPTNTVWRYDPATDTWGEVGVMPEQRLAGAAVTLGDKIYVAGGVGGGEALLEFTPSSSQWRLLPGPVQAREHVNAVAFGDELWLLGGRWAGVGELATVEIYNPTSETWRAGPTMNVARAGFAAAVVQQQLMVAGGEVIINGRETLASLEILASGSDTWQLGPDLLVPMHGVGGAEFQGRFLLLGGSMEAGAILNEGQVQIYEPH
jgi:N-acetylneuraminic acid mutarotase